eukprot:387950-Rhodomonas_salina.1
MERDCRVSARATVSVTAAISPRMTTASSPTWKEKQCPGSELYAPAPTRRALPPPSVGRSWRLPS